jgi:hypothetical protein
MVNGSDPLVAVRLIAALENPRTRRSVKRKRFIAASVVAAAILAPGSAALAGNSSGKSSKGSLVTVGSVEVVDDVCTNVNINTGTEKNKKQSCK